MPTVAEMVEWLFQNIRGPDGEQFTTADVEPFVRSRGGSLSALIKIRNGEVTDPGHPTLRSIATFFGVPTSYFTEANRTQAYLEGILARVALSRELPRAIVLRAIKLPPEEQERLLEYIEFRHSRDRR